MVRLRLDIGDPVELYIERVLTRADGRFESGQAARQGVRAVRTVICR
jgi:hypothetical protein